MRRAVFITSLVAALSASAAPAGAHSVDCTEARLEAARTAADFVEFLAEERVHRSGYAYELGRCTPGRLVKRHRHNVTYSVVIELLAGPGSSYVKQSYTIRVGYASPRSRHIDGDVYRADGKRARQPD